MRFSKEIEYALISLMAMSDSDGLSSARDLAKRFHIPHELLSKILQRLVARGIADSVKGAHGGYRLRRPGGEITLGEVMTAVQGPRHVARCLDDEDCFQAEVCNIKRSIRTVQSIWDRTINSMTLDDFGRTASRLSGPT